MKLLMLFEDSIDVDERVSKIRNHIHLYGKKRGQNQKDVSKNFRLSY